MSYAKKIQSMLEDQVKGKDRQIKITDKKGNEKLVSKIDNEIYGEGGIADKISEGVKK